MKPEPGAKETGTDSVVPVPSSPSISGADGPRSEQHGMERQFSFFSIIGLAFAILNVSCPTLMFLSVAE